MTRDTALSRRLGSLLNPEIAVVPAASCYAPPRALYFALYPALYSLPCSTIPAPAHHAPCSARLATHATVGSIHGSKDTRQDAERDSTRTRVRSDFASPLFSPLFSPLCSLFVSHFYLFLQLLYVRYVCTHISLFAPITSNLFHRFEYTRNKKYLLREITRLIASTS